MIGIREMSKPVSILVLTKNEEVNLPACLETVAWADDIHVLDSYSTDGTLDIAKAFNAKIAQRHFDSFSSQQNWALQNLSFKYPWVFYIDADERVTMELRDSIVDAVQNPLGNVAFRVQRRDFFMDTWLKHVQASPYYLRLFRPEKMCYERLGHPVSKPDGPIGQITGYLDHYPFSKGIRDWIDRHNFYSSQEAEQIILNQGKAAPVEWKKAVFSQDFHERRYHQKELYYRFPFRPAIKFFALYVLKRGYLDGRAGMTYASLMFFYEYMIIVKTRELKQKALKKHAV